MTTIHYWKFLFMQPSDMPSNAWTSNNKYHKNGENKIETVSTWFFAQNNFGNYLWISEHVCCLTIFYVFKVHLAISSIEVFFAEDKTLEISEFIKTISKQEIRSRLALFSKLSKFAFSVLIYTRSKFIARAKCLKD